MDFENNSVKVNGHKIEFEARIDTVIEFSNYYVVLILNDDIPDNNVYAINKKGEIVWNIGDIIQLSYPEAYTSIGKEAENLSLISYNGIRYLLNTSNNTYSKVSITK